MASSSSTPINKKPTPKADDPKVDQLPPWKIILHNDDVNTAEFVVKKVQEITKLEEDIAAQKVLEAHDNECALLLTTHQEKAEFLVELFDSYNIMVTMEKA